MKKKILRSALLTTIGTALLFTVLVSLLMLHFFTEQSLQLLEQDVKRLAVSLNRDADPVAQLEDLKAGGFALRVTLIDGDGGVLYDSSSEISGMDNHLSREEIAQAAQSGFGQAARYSPTLREQTYYAAVRLDSGSFLRLAETRSSVLMLLADLLRFLLPALALICLMAVFVASLLTRKIVRPINAIDPDNPDRSTVYPELRPLLDRMHAQKRSIQEYISVLDSRSNEFETITAGMAEGLILMNPHGEVLMMNRSASRIFRTEDAVGRSILEISDSPAFVNALLGRRSEEILQTGGRVYRLLVNPVYDSGHFSGLFALIPDITEQHLAEQNRREFTANISHELKTPLTSIAGYAEIMQSGIAAKEDWKELVGCIHRESTRMIRLVEDILHLSRLDSGALYTDREALSLLDLAREIAQRFSAAAQERGVSIHVDGCDCVLNASRRMMEEIISNLIDNAVKYNREGGTVQLRLSRSQSCILLSVEDSGIGIPEEHQGRIFERFYRVDKSRSKATGGTGLGLSIVKHAVQRLGGSIRLDSHPGEGTAITVVLPESDGENA